MVENCFDELMLDAAEEHDKKLRPERIAQLKQSYAFFKKTGHSDDEIKTMMALTAHEMRLITHS